MSPPANIITVQSEPVVLMTMVVAGVTLLSLFYFGRKKALDGGSPKTLRPTEYLSLPLVQKIEVSHDTRIFRLGLPTPQHTLGLPIGQHISLKATIKDKEVMRSYTPISSDDDKGYVDLLVKVYFANVHPKFPEGGAMSQHLESLKVGDTILVKGPSGRLEYVRQGLFKMKQGQNWVDRKVRRLAMIAGGTGITPLLQLVRAVLKNPEDKTEMWLLFANQTEQDILLRTELEQCAKDPRFHVWYTLDRPGEGWTYSTGFISAEMIAERLPPAGPDAMVLMCGPPPMIQFACKPNLEKAGYTAEQMFTF
jgi:cytochrome-b5 reductase